MIEIGKLRELEAAATKGPWKQHAVDDTCVIDARCKPVCDTWPEGGEDDDIDFASDTERRESDAALIAAMRNALPELLNLASRAEKAREEALREAAAMLGKKTRGDVMLAGGEMTTGELRTAMAMLSYCSASILSLIKTPAN